MPVPALRRMFTGGSAGNAQLTAAVATVLLVLLAVEGATLLNIGSLLTVHAFVGMLLIPVIMLKLASTGWRMVRYYARAEEYVRYGPPQVMLRVLVAPVILASTLILFGTGVALLVAGQTSGTLVSLHKASFFVWVGSTSLHVLAHALSIPRALQRHVPGRMLRLAVVGVALLGGAGLAVATLPAADRLQDRASSSVGFDAR